MNIQEIRQQYPQYQDMSDEQLATALHSKFYADMPYADFAGKVGVSKEPVKQPGERSIADSIARQLGLTARSAIGGIAGIPNAIADPIVGGINALGGNLPVPSQALERTMTRAGLPEPDSGTERFAQSVNRGMVGPAAMAKVIPALGANLGTQVAAGGMAAGGGDIAKEAGAGPMGQFIASLLSGLVPTAGLATGQGLGNAAGRGVKALFQPFTAGGRDKIIARTLQSAATDKQTAADNALAAPQFVPGTQTTLAQASEDAGLAGLEKAVKTRNKEVFADIEAKNDAARQAGLERSFGNDTNLKAAEAARDAVTKPLRDQVFAEAKPVNVKPIADAADSILKSGAGKREGVSKAMTWVKGQLDGESNAERIYAVRQDLNDIIVGKMKDPEKASYQLAAKELIAVKGVLDRQIEQAAPGFKNYLREYADRSTPINAMRTGQEIAAAGKNPLSERLSPAAFTRTVSNRADDVANMGAIGSDVISRVNQDLKRSVAPDILMRSSGSDTTQNLLAQNVLGNALGPVGNSALPRLVNKGLSLAYSPFEQQTQEQLLQALLDPKRGSRLLSTSIAKDPRMVEELLRRLGVIPQGAAFGIGASQ